MIAHLGASLVEEDGRVGRVGLRLRVPEVNAHPRGWCVGWWRYVDEVHGDVEDCSGVNNHSGT